MVVEREKCRERRRTVICVVILEGGRGEGQIKFK